MRKPRTEHDSWGIERSVGSTAVGAAAARAVETKRPDAVAQDAYAELLVNHCAGNPFWKATLEPDFVDKLEQVSARAAMHVRHIRAYTATRTRFFDEFCRTAVDGGVRQVVILAAGLDCRAHRLRWPSGVTVWEIDQPNVLRYKSAVLGDYIGPPKIQHHYVPIDLRQDWPTALIEAQFDASVPAAWLAEGLMMYLPAKAQHHLLASISVLSAHGSHVAADTLPPRGRQYDEQTDAAMTYAALALGLRQDLSINKLMYHDQAPTAIDDWLNRHGWRSTVVNSADEMRALNRWPEGMPSTGGEEGAFSTAHRP